MFKAATIASKEIFSQKIGRKMGEALINKLGQSPNACWLFCSPEQGFEHLLAGICSVIDTPNLIGCTTDGEISDMGYSSRSAVLGGLCSDSIEFCVVSSENIDRDGEQAGRELATKLPASVQYIQLFSDGLTGNGCAILRGMASGLDDGVQISGGAAGDAGMFQQTWQFTGNKVFTNSAVAIGMKGDITVSTGMRSGWAPIGLPKKVTRASKNVLYELNGESALKVYERFLGKHAQGLPKVGVEYPLGIVGPCPDGTDDNYCLLRAATSVNRNDGSLHLGGEIPEGSKVYMTCGDISSILDATRNAARIAKEGLNDTPPRMIFFYSCMARKILLGLRINEEFALIREQFGHNVPIVGFYSYGEYCQAGCGGPCLLNNENAVVLVLGC